MTNLGALDFTLLHAFEALFVERNGKHGESDPAVIWLRDRVRHVVANAPR